MAMSTSGSLSISMALVMFLAAFGLKGKFKNYIRFVCLRLVANVSGTNGAIPLSRTFLICGKGGVVH